MTAPTQVSGHPISEAPPIIRIGPARWVYKNLFGSWTNTLLTLLGLLLLYGLGRAAAGFLRQSEWEVVTRNLTLFAIGQFPRDQAWRTLASLEIVWALAAISAILWMRPGWGRMVLGMSFPLWAAYWIAVSLANVAPGVGFHNGLRVFLLVCAAGIALGTWRGWRVKLLRRIALVLWVLSPLVIQLLLSGIKSAPLIWFTPLTNALIVEIILVAAYLIVRPRRPDIGQWIIWSMLLPVLYFVLFRYIITVPLVPRIGYQFYLPPAILDLLPPIRTQLWSGLLLTLVLTVVGIVGSFPLGVLLALGRRSDLPIIKLICTLYIELFRGVPLITILFMAQVMLPLFLETDVDAVVRAMIGIMIFSSAYLAENVRGGLQAIQIGRIEAAQALGLNPALVTSLIVLPQALRIVIPAIVGLFISLFKDTTLVSIVTLLDLLGIAKAALAQNPAFQFHKTEVYLFIAAIYFVVSYGMSSAARRLETATSAMGGTREL